MLSAKFRYGIRSKIVYQLLAGAFVFYIALSNQNCGGTVIKDPFRGGKVDLKFDKYSAPLKKFDVCLTNILFELSEIETDYDPKNGIVTLPDGLDGGFDKAYLYFDSSLSRYFINGVFYDKQLSLDSQGTLIGNYHLPGGVYEKAVVGFSPCATADNTALNPSVRIENNSGTFADQPQQFFAIEYVGYETLLRSLVDGFNIRELSEELSGISSQAELLDVLQPYRRFDLINFVSTHIPHHNMHRLQTMAQQSDGKIVVGGYGWLDYPSTENDNNSRSIVARYNVDGTIDATFGNGSFLPGAVSLPTITAQRWGGVQAIQVATDGSIYAFGSSTEIYSNYMDFVIFKLRSNGEIDTSFGNNGLFRYDNNRNEDWAHDLALLPDGSLLAIGISTNYDVVMLKISATGVLDRSFGQNGVKSIDFKPWDYSDPVTLALQSDGKIIASMRYNDSHGMIWAVDRYLPNGNKDLTFGALGPTPGRVKIGIGGNPNDVVVQNDGKILVAGTSDRLNGDFVVARLNAQGSMDESFGTAGKASHDFGGHDAAKGISINRLGQIIVSGDAQKGTKFNYALLVLDNFGAPDVRVSENGTRTFSVNTTGDGGDMLIRNIDNSIVIGGSGVSAIDLLFLAP